MKTQKNPDVYLDGKLVPQLTHAEEMRRQMDKVRSRVCRLCKMTPEAYEEMHYDIAESWLYAHNYLEYTARTYMLSGTFHRWWNQQASWAERRFLLTNNCDTWPSDVVRRRIHAAIISLDVKPSYELRGHMHAEGLKAILNNQQLAKIRIFRRGKK